jgi:cell division cycle 20, cofactor of APC complex
MVASSSKEAYRRLLAGKLFNNQTHIFAFRNKLPEPENMSITNVASSNL